MGNQLKMIIVVVFTFYSSSLFPQKQKNFKEAQGYLLYYCIKEEYNSINSNKKTPYNKDYSGSYYVQMTDLPLQLLDSLHLYYKSKIGKYRGIPQESSSDSLANMTCWSCLQLIEAKETRRYIKKCVKMK